MSLHASRSRAFSLFVLVLVLVVPAGRSLGQDKQPKRLPQAIVEAWKQRGARVGRLRNETFSDVRFWPLWNTSNPGDVPTFRIDLSPHAVAGKLPPPQQPFGIELVASEVT